jgi:hypothetical protein
MEEISLRHRLPDQRPGLATPQIVASNILQTHYFAAFRLRVTHVSYPLEAIGMVTTVTCPQNFHPIDPIGPLRAITGTC